MSIGLFDQDINTFGNLPFNLEIMKLSTYYKRKRELVGFAPTFCPERYTKMFYRKDYDDGRFNKKLLQYDNVEYGGLSFTNNEYIPLPLEVELCPPDYSIYDNYIDVSPLKDSDRKKYKTMRNSIHIRLSLDGKTVWKDYLKPEDWNNNKQIVFIHDYNITEIKGNYEAVCAALTHGDNNMKRYLDTKFPIVVYNYEDLIKWLNLPLTKRCVIEYRGLMRDEDVIKLAELPQYALSHITYDPTYGTKDEDDFCKNNLQKVFKQLTFLRSKKRYLSLIYSASILADPLWVVVFTTWNSYFATIKGVPNDKIEQVMAFDSYYNFIKRSLKPRSKFLALRFTKETMREAFKMIYEKDYATFADFYECHGVKYEGGGFV